MALFFDLLALFIALAVGVYGGLHLSVLMGKSGVEKIVGVGGGKAAGKTVSASAQRIGKSYA
jgi:hypothetical protein